MSIVLKNQIIGWLKNQEYWFQYAGYQLLEGVEVSNELVDSTYTYFKEDAGLQKSEGERVQIKFNEVSEAESTNSDKLSLISIHGIENVNALAKEQRIEIGKNLTIVYGNNGSGKSGYIRLLNNAFNSRGDKLLLANVFDEGLKGQPTCNFEFQTPESSYSKQYPNDKSSYEFTRFAVLDTHSVKIHLDSDNQLNFTPRGFEFFEKALQLLENLRDKLQSEIELHKPQNNFIIHFQHDNEVKRHISTLGPESDEVELKRLGTFTETDSFELDEIKRKIEGLKSLNIQLQINSLERLQRDIEQIIVRQQLILNSLSKENVDKCISLIDDIKNLQHLSKAQGIKSLEDYKISLVGSSPWREFIVAARSYSTAIEQERKTHSSYPSKNDICLFCLQPLTAKERTLTETYWQFLKSEAERELNRHLQKVRDTVKELKGLNPVKFDESLGIYDYIHQHDGSLAEKWKEIVTKSEASRQNLISNLESLNKEKDVSYFEDSVIDLHTIDEKIKNEINSLFAKKPDQEIASLTFQANLLTDRSLLAKLLTQVLEFSASHKWAYLAEQSLSKLKTNSITTFQGELFTQNITDKFKELFNVECKKLNAPQFVDIVQQNSKVKTFRKLRVANQTVSQILSEGEQRAISLADFLTETNINPNNKGLIFDDPVTSLDHLRRGLIAKRLVEVAQSKQVIVFTHDLLFVNQLKNMAETMAIDFKCHWIERQLKHTGHIYNNNSPATEGDYKNTLLAEKALKDAISANPESREKILKDGFASLRTNYEYLIIFDLFKQVVLRFDERVSVERLREVVVLPTITERVIDKVGLLSRYIEAHLHSDSFVYTKPTTDDLKKEIAEFLSVKKELKEMRDKILKGE